MKLGVIELSNLIVKAYIKRDRRISFHLSTHLIIETETYFDSTALKELQAHFVLSTGENINFARRKWVASPTDFDYNFDGKTKVINIHLETITEFKSIKNSAIELEINCVFELGTISINSKKTIKSSGLLKKMYDERRFK